MMSGIVARLFIDTCGTLYPAYATYKAMTITDHGTRSAEWRMYWIVFALFRYMEIYTDLFLLPFLPFYNGLKVILVLWFLSPVANGSSVIYRRYLHPALKHYESRIDMYIERLWKIDYAISRQTFQKVMGQVFRLIWGSVRYIVVVLNVVRDFLIISIILLYNRLLHNIFGKKSKYGKYAFKIGFKKTITVEKDIKSDDMFKENSSSKNAENVFIETKIVSNIDLNKERIIPSQSDITNEILNEGSQKLKDQKSITTDQSGNGLNVTQPTARIAPQIANLALSSPNSSSSTLHSVESRNDNAITQCNNTPCNTPTSININQTPLKDNSAAIIKLKESQRSTNKKKYICGPRTPQPYSSTFCYDSCIVLKRAHHRCSCGSRIAKDQ